MSKVLLPQAAGLLALLGVSACADPITDVMIDDWRPEVATPLLETSFTLRDALEGTTFDEYIDEDAEGGLRVGISEELFDYRVADNVPLVPLAFPMITPETTVDFEGLGFDFPVTLIDLTGVTATVELRNDHALPATVTVTSDNFDIDGAPLEHVFTVPAGATAVDSFRASAAQFRLSGDGSVTVRYEANLVGGPAAVQLSGGSFGLRGNDFAYAEGTLTEIGFGLSLDSTRFPFFDAFEPGTVSLVNPSATLTIDNNVGAPVQFRSPDSYFGYRDGTRRTLESPLTDGVDMAYPAFGEGAVAKTTTLELDDATSNFAELLSGLPNFVNFGLDCRLNPDDVAERFFIHRDARVTGHLEVDVPLALRFDGFEVAREFPIDGSGFDQAVSASFRLRVENGFGLGARLQLAFFDAGGEEIAEVFPEAIEVLRAAEVDALGKSVGNSAIDVELPVSAAAIAALRQASTARVTLLLDSPAADAAGGADYTQLYYDNAVAVELGALITLDGEAAAAFAR